MVMEGIWPFLDPGSMRNALINLVDQDDQTLRILGFASMVLGVVLLYLVH